MHLLKPDNSKKRSPESNPGKYTMHSFENDVDDGHFRVL
jgi:hypothetical protein